MFLIDFEIKIIILFTENSIIVFVDTESEKIETVSEASNSCEI